MKEMNSEGRPEPITLRHLATELHEVCSQLNEIRANLEGGGIVQARDIEPAVSMAIPRLRSAVATIYAATKHEENGSDQAGALNQNPLLM